MKIKDMQICLTDIGNIDLQRKITNHCKINYLKYM